MKTIDVEIKYIEEVSATVKALQATGISFNEIKFPFKHSLEMTMADGKVLNAAIETNSISWCCIFGATSKDFNVTDEKKKSCLTGANFGLSILHVRTRLFESVLYLAYKPSVKNYKKNRIEKEVQLKAQTKRYIQERFQTEIATDSPRRATR